MNKRWTTYENNDKHLESIMTVFKVPEIIARALINRGIDTVQKVQDFLNTDMEHLNDPYLMKGMADTAERIMRALEQKDKICVYGDYDVDGITSTAIMMKTLIKLGADPIYYIPKRLEEGYGLSTGSMDKIKESGVRLIITVDCGIRSNEVVEYARKLGMEIIITDHHECDGELPNAVSILNPHQPECGYPYKNLAGVGVAYKLASALLSGKGYSDFAEEMIDIVSIGTIADVVPLLGENRIIVKNGLKKIPQTRNKGIRALLEVCGMNDKELNSYNVAFMLAPRINAAGRIANASLCVELLLTEDSQKAMDIAKKLDSDNRERQSIETVILDGAIAAIERTVDFDKDKVLVLENDNWHVGVIGIVASRLVDRYYLPTFIMSREGDLCKGSARSIPGFNLFEAMSKYGDLFEKFGGHEMAAGFTIRKEKVDMLREKMNTEIGSVLSDTKLIPQILVDYKLSAADISLDTVRQLKILEPFGTGNPSPLYVFRGLKVMSSRAVGNEGKHLALTAYDGHKEIKCIAYNFGSMQKTLSIGKKIDIICSVENNVWNDIESVQLNVKDIKLTK